MKTSILPIRVVHRCLTVDPCVVREGDDRADTGGWPRSVIRWVGRYLIEKLLLPARLEKAVIFPHRQLDQSMSATFVVSTLIPFRE